jgi:SagB-type dehydrogenase family enzyme
MSKKVGDKFQQETKYSRNSVGNGFEWVNPPELYKNYPNCKKIKLIKSNISTKKSLDEVLKNRKSIRYFSKKPINIQELSYLLWASTGIQRNENGYDYRTAPSAGALYPIETYLVINNVENLPQGVYHYLIKDHALEELKLGDFSYEIAKAALDQNMCTTASIVFIWSAIFNRSKCKYGQRAFRYVYLDAGHIAQNLVLASTSLNIGSCPIAALYDEEINKIICVDGIEESVIYMSAIGNIRKESDIV